MPEEAIHQLMVLARAAHGWSKWRKEAERTGNFARSPEIDMLEDAAERALAAITRLGGVKTVGSSGTPALVSIDPAHLVTLCASCKDAQTQEGNWISIESYLHQAHQTWVSHSLCEVCAADTRAALRAAPA